VTLVGQVDVANVILGTIKTIDALQIGELWRFRYNHEGFIVCFFLQILAAKVRKKKHYEVYNHSIMVEKTSKGLVKREKSTNFAHDISEE
jgi:hypothetical protein